MKYAVLSLLFGLMCCASPLSAQDASPHQKVVVPFDFESRFDRGEYGRNLGDMIWTKLKQRGGFILLESMQNMRDWFDRSQMLPDSDTPMDQVKEIVVGEFHGDIGIWGKIERVPSQNTDVYDFWIKVADFSVDPPRVIFERKAQTKTVSEIPNVHVKAALDALYNQSAPAPAGPDAGKEERWKSSPNLLPGGDFEVGRAGPDGWEPLPAGITWVKEPGATAPNKILRYDLTRGVAESTGLFVYSSYFPIEEGATYRFQCRWRTNGPACKVFIKCADELATGLRTQSGQALNTEKREVYRNQQNLTGPKDTWNTQTEDFTPKHTMYSPKSGRVMLYAYLKPGTVEWDDVVVKQIAPPPSDYQKNKDPRPSSETKVRLKDMQK